MKTRTKYICEVCGTEYRSKRLAAFCESGAVPRLPTLKRGARCFSYNGDCRDWDERVFGGYEVAPGMAASHGIDHEDSDPHVDHLLTFSPAHEIRVQLAPELNRLDDGDEEWQSPDHVVLPGGTAALDGSDRILGYRPLPQ